MSDLDNLLDSTLDDLEDLPTFEPYPAGAHKVLVTLESKEVNDKPCVEVSCKLIETLELSEPTKDNAPAEGSSASILCFLDNEFGRGALKKLATPLGVALGTSTIREVVEQATDVECVIMTSLKQDKTDKTLYRMNIKELQVA